MTCHSGTHTVTGLSWADQAHSPDIPKHTINGMFMSAPCLRKKTVQIFFCQISTNFGNF